MQKYYPGLFTNNSGLTNHFNFVYCFPGLFHAVFFAGKPFNVGGIAF